MSDQEKMYAVEFNYYQLEEIKDLLYKKIDNIEREEVTPSRFSYITKRLEELESVYAKVNAIMESIDEEHEKDEG